jgi:enoyl-CoA hydratase/carnithine racemase
VSAIETIGLVRRTSMEPIARMALVGRAERLPAARAHQLGIVSEVVDPPDRLRERAQEIAETIARHAPETLAAVKHALWDALEQ